MGSLLLIKCGNSVCNAVCSIPTGKRGPTGSFNINDKAYLGKDANIMYLGSNLPIHKYHTCLLHSLGSETLFMKIFDHMTLSVTFDLQFKNLNAYSPSLRFATLNVHVFYIYTPPPPPPSPFKLLNGIQWNVTGSKISTSTSSTKFVFFGPIRKTRWLPKPLIGWDIFNFSSETA